MAAGLLYFVETVLVRLFVIGAPCMVAHKKKLIEKRDCAMIC